MTENMQIAMQAINKWNYFCWNYKTERHNWIGVHGEPMSEHIPVFLAEIKWTCSLDHMVDKWFKSCQYDDPYSYLPRFYSELDLENRSLLLEWIMKNYNGEIKLI